MTEDEDLNEIMAMVALDPRGVTRADMAMLRLMVELIREVRALVVAAELIAESKT